MAFSIIPTLLKMLLPDLYGNQDTFYLNGGYCGLWLIVLYIIGAYIRKYDILE